MKKGKIIQFFLILAVFASSASAQQLIPYGSDKGNYLQVNKTKIYYEEYGKGTPLLLLRGGLSSIKGFANVIPELSKYFRVIAVDAPGQGRSEQADSVSFQLMASYYSKMIDLLKLDSVYVYGFSVGSITAMHLASDRPDKVKRVVAHAGVNHLSGYNEGFDGTNEMTPEIVEEYVKWWLDGHRKHSPQPEKWKKFINDFKGMWNPHEFISHEKMRKIKSCVLILQGDQDLIKIENAIHMHQQINDSQLAILPNTAHFVLHENPALLLRVVTPFLLREPNLKYELSY
jgi:pimeloyl-ACP methyl ester carboxylesterase